MTPHSKHLFPSPSYYPFFLRHPQLSVVTPSLRAIGNILTGGDPLTQVVINCSVLPVLKHLLESHIEQIRKETCWALSNVTAGNKVQIQVSGCGMGGVTDARVS